ncbi:hypothetical protein J437_LFUL005226 [Ladona fulva]|uniref:MADF domain-containing protein n=1 Tax=Ladona fulva TaxID=123851 RepID=A0A8K0P6F0_LADFU|nr:hypothetical protein J437_LFUL005226 [Ladona fulva]
MEWSNELIFEFIGLYEKYPILWNPKHQGHRNTIDDAWLNIAREISTDVTVELLRKIPHGHMQKFVKKS